MSGLVIPETVVHQLWAITQVEYPREACGFLIGDEQGYFGMRQLRNYAPDPTQEFWMNPLDVEQYVKLYLHVATWHSHPNGLWNLSALDRQLMMKSQLPMAVVAPKPYPAVALYVVQEGQCVCAAKYRIEEAVCSK